MLPVFGTRIAASRRAALAAAIVAPVLRPHLASAQDAFAGSLYMQSNERQNRILQFGRRPDGTLVPAASVPTGGAGSGEFKPVSGQESAPNAFEGAGSVILADGNRLLFATNGGDNTVSSFRVGGGGALTRIDVQPTGEPVTGRSGTAKSLAFAPRTRTLYVLHAFGPNHIRAFRVDAEGRLSLTPERSTVNTTARPDRIPTQIVLSPDGRFALVDILFDARPATNADGTDRLDVANMPGETDGLVVFPVAEDGRLGAPSFQDAGGAGPFYIAFLHDSRDTFVNGTAVGDGLVLSRLDREGRVTVGPLVPINTGAGKPSELCWLQITRDNGIVLATNFGYGTVSSYRLRDGRLSLLKDPAHAPVPGDGTFRAVNGLVSSGPSDSWLTPDDRFFHQIYGNASVLVSWRLDPRDGSLTEVGRSAIPYNSPQGLAGF